MNPVICLDSDDEDPANGKKATKQNNSMNIQTTMPITITKTTQSNSVTANQSLYKSIKNSMSITPVHSISSNNNNNQNPPPLTKLQSSQITNKYQILDNMIRTSPITHKNQLKNNQVQITTFKPVNPQLKSSIATNIIQKNQTNFKTSSTGITIKSNSPGITVKSNSTLTSTPSKTTSASNSPIICSSNSIEVTRIANPTTTLTNLQKNSNHLKIITSPSPISNGSGITIIPSIKNKSLDGLNHKNNTNLKTSSVQCVNPKLPTLNQHLQEKLAQYSTLTITKGTDNLQEKNIFTKNILEFQKIQQENIKKIQKNQKLGKQNSLPVGTNHITNTITSIRNEPLIQKSPCNPKTQNSIKKNIARMQKNLISKTTINNLAQNLPNISTSPTAAKKFKIKLNSNGIENKVNLNSTGMNKKILTNEQQRKDYLIAQAQMAKLNSNKNLPVNNKSTVIMNKMQQQQHQQQQPIIVNAQNNNNKIIQSNKNQSSFSGTKRKISESIITSPSPSPQPYKRIKPTLVSTIVSPKYTTTNSLITIDIEDEDLFIDKSVFPKDMAKSVPSSPKISTPNTPTSNSPLSVKEIFSPIELSPKKLETDSKTPKSNEDLDLELIEPKANNKKNEEIIESLESKSNSGTKIEREIEKNIITTEYEALLAACRKAESSDEMELLIKKKLLKYYHSVHPDFIKSKNFLKTIKATTQDIEENPNLVYIKLKNILEELKTRKNSKLSVMTNENNLITTNINLDNSTEENGLNHIQKKDKRDRQVKKLSNTLLKIKLIISKLEEEDVDLDNDYNSTYLQVERYKKRACQIYEKICELTGESKHAQREVRKPIIFKGTKYPIINITIQTFVNRTKSFPDYQDILRLLEYCNNNNKMDLSAKEMGEIAEDAFNKVGTLLQKRRKTELYETVTHWAGDKKDPAAEDAILNAKLNENHKNCKKISEVINKYAKRQSGIIVSSDSEHSDCVAKSRLKKCKPLVSSDEDETDIGSTPTTNLRDNFKSSNSRKPEKNDSLSNLNCAEKPVENDTDLRLTEELIIINEERIPSPQPGPSGINAKSLTSQIDLTDRTSATRTYSKSLNSNVNNNVQNTNEKTKSRRNNNNENHKVVCQIILSDDDESILSDDDESKEIL